MPAFRRAAGPYGRRPGRQASLAAFALAAVGLLAAAGCGGGPRPASVASLATTTSGGGTASGAGRSVAFALPPGGAGIGTSISIDVGSSAGVRYAACMQSHGVPGFPDPNGQGEITITVSSSLDPGSPLFQRAETACDHLIPAGEGLSPARQQRLQTALLAFAACMRAHGVPGYPDPKFGPGGVVSQGFSRRSGVDPNSPLYRSAQASCRSALPGPGG